MPRCKPVFKRRKDFKTKKPRHSRRESTNLPSTSFAERSLSVSSSSSCSSPIPSCSSASSSKISRNLDEYDLYETEEVNDITSYSRLNSELKGFGQCTSCAKGDLVFDVIRRYGLASQISLSCSNCCASKVFSSCDKIRTNNLAGKEAQAFTLNVRFAYACRSIGKGYAAGKLLCATMNLPPPSTKHSFYEKFVGIAAEKVGQMSMNAAVQEAVIETGGHTDLAVSLDGSWQKRGHTSLNGVTSAISIDTGKVFDVSVLSKFCTCPDKNIDKHKDNCTANYKGTSGGMEVKGASDIFERSKAKLVRYTKYLGDGDCKAFKEVFDSQPYGPDCPIEKLECIGHVQKRMGTRLRSLKATMKRNVLEDKKSLGGKGRLTDRAIDSLQKYYGLAIRRNPDSLKEMTKAVWSSFCHTASSDENPLHGLCSVEWCKYLKAQKENTSYSHKDHFHLSSVIMKEIKPIYEDLSKPELLKKCLHGKTQNANESLNNIIWSRIPKNIFVRLPTFKLGVYEAVCTFNDGHISKCRILQEMGISPGLFCCEALRKIDETRIKESKKAIMDLHKNARKKRSLARKKLETRYDEDEGENPSYKTGGH